MAKFTEGQPVTNAALASQPVRDNLDALFQMDLKSLRPRAQSSPNMTLQVAADQDTTYYGNNNPLNYAGGNSPAVTAPTGNSRISVLVIDAAGNLTWIDGSEAASPAEPTIPEHVIPLCSVFCRVGMTSIKNTDDSTNGYILKDRRPFINAARTQGVPGHSGLVATASSSLTVDAYTDATIFRNRGTSYITTVYGVGSFRCNVGSGPVIGGRDTAGTFNAGSWVYVYQATDATTYGLLASSAAPPTGPNSVANAYTHWSYLGVFRFNASSIFTRARLAGDRLDYHGRQNIVSAGTATAETSVSVAALVPPSAQYWHGTAHSGIAAQTGGSFVLKYVTSLDYIILRSAFTTQFASLDSTVSLPNVSQQFFYNWTATPDTGMDVDVLGYTIPNGGK